MFDISLPDIIRREYAQLLTSGGQLLLLVLGIHLHTQNGWLFCCSMIVLVSVFAWLSLLDRLRTLRNTPISRIASAAQGYVALIGRGQPYSDTPLLATLSRLPCLWCCYKIEYRDSKGNWEKTDSGETNGSFVICDDSGECVIDPEHAEITTRHYERWIDEDYRYSEWKLMKQDVIHVVGQFSTDGASTLEFDNRVEMSSLLTEWKKDMPSLLARFDLNKDGALSMDEWALAQQAARREVDAMLKQARAQPDMHYVSKPKDGRVYLISNFSPQRLIRRYLLWSWLHLVIFLGSLGAIGWLLQHGDW